MEDVSFLNNNFNRSSATGNIFLNFLKFLFNKFLFLNQFYDKSPVIEKKIHKKLRSIFCFIYFRIIIQVYGIIAQGALLILIC